jgi:hypothetical protein
LELVVAQTSEALRRISAQWGTRAAGGTFLLMLLAIAVILVLILVGLSYWRRERKGRVYSHRKLFLELASGHRLSGTERRFLRRLAPLAKVRHPTYLFVRSDLFFAGVDRWRATHPDAGGELLDALASKLHPNRPIDGPDPAESSG